MRAMSNRQRLLRLLLAASLVLAPMLSIAQPMAGHAAMADHAATTPGDHAGHHMTADTAAMDAGQACAQHADHDACQGQCCAACAHCFVAMPGVESSNLPLQPVRTPVVSQLSVSAEPAFLNRPPQG
jgi:hypothetical protein